MTRRCNFAAGLAVAAILAVSGAGAQAAPRGGSVLALTYVSGSGWSQLGPVDRFTLRPAGDTVRLRGSVDSWSFSPDGSQVALASRSLVLNVLDARSLRVVRELRLAQRGVTVQAVTWLRPDRLLALVTVANGLLVVAADPQAGTIVRTTRLGGLYGYGFGRFPDRLAFLLDAGGRIAAPRVVVADADGRVRTATLGRILSGTVVVRSRPDPHVRQRTVGFAVDPAGGRVYVVDRDFAVAEVDAATLAVRYHAPTVRATARARKLIEGSARSAAWLRGGMLLAGGVDWTVTGGRTTPNQLPVRLIDVRSWSFRTLDVRGAAFQIGSGLVLLRERNDLHAFGADGGERFRATLAGNAWLVPGDGLLYACRSLSLASVLDAATGAVVRSGAQLDGSPCAQVLVGGSSPG